MTGPCSGAGVGTPKPGFGGLIYVGPAAIGGALAGLSGWAGAAVGAAIGTITYDLVTFCPNGPPAMPTFSASDIVALLNPGLGPIHTAAALKFQDFLGNVFWGKLCDCSSGTSVVPAPATYPSSGPVAPSVPLSTAPCRTNLLTDTTAHAASGSYTTFGPSGEMTGGAWVLLNSTVTTVRFTGVNTVVTGAGVTCTWNISYSDSAGTTVRNDSLVVAPGATATLVSNPPINANSFVMASSGTGTGTSRFNGSLIERFCNGTQPGGTQTPCCPPDPTLQAQIDAILNMVTLIQRQSVPFSYVASTAHTALSGAGSFDISGLIGVAIQVTTLPTPIGREGTSPTEYFDMGFITFGTPDGYPSSYRLERESQVLLPARCGAYTTIAYDLHPGVVVTITELVREP